MNFCSTWNNLFKHCISVDILLVGYVQGALQKKLRIVPFVERFKKLLWETVTGSVYGYFKENAFKHCFLVDNLLIEG